LNAIVLFLVNTPQPATWKLLPVYGRRRIYQAEWSEAETRLRTAAFSQMMRALPKRPQNQSPTAGFDQWMRRRAAALISPNEGD
jgi:hypothetical protein